MKKILFILLVLSFVFNSCKKEIKTEEKSTPFVLVRTSKVEVKELSVPIVSSGIVSSTKEAKLSFKTGGIIERMEVEEGQNVKKGQLLATLKMTEINAQVHQAQQGFEKAQRDYNRVSNLYKDSTATLEQLQNAKTALEIATQTLEIAKFNQQYSSIYSTENGKVLKKIMNEGELVSAGMPVYVIHATQDNDWVIRVGVSDKNWALIELGDNAKVKLDAYPDDTFEANVVELAQVAEMSSGLFSVELKINPKGKRLATGLIGKVEISSKKSQKLTFIPVESLVEANGNKGIVFGLQEDKQTVKKLEVNINKIFSDKLAVTGLNEVKEVITDGAMYLNEGYKVKLAE
ncbi:MAG: efflux RND transporter periplasmic adaptor subunit [Flammeovirgaceae bacterium]